MDKLPTGCLIDAKVTSQVCQAIEAGQLGPARAASFQRARPSFRGAWSRLRARKPDAAVFGHEAELKLFGRLLPSWHQLRGTCVEQGCDRAAESAWHQALAFRGAIGSPVMMAVSITYALSRALGGLGGCAPWGVRGGETGDGSFVAAAMQSFWLNGLLAMGVYGEYDLTRHREDLAVNFCNNGVPSILKEAAAPYKLQSQNIAGDKDCLMAIADALTSRLTVPIALPRYVGPRNANGVSVLQRAGDHCTYLRGVCTVSDRLHFIYQQSHGDDQPPGPNILKHDGGDEPLAPGECAIDAEDFMDNLRIRGEVWVLEIPSTVSWRAK